MVLNLHKKLNSPSNLMCAVSFEYNCSTSYVYRELHPNLVIQELLDTSLIMLGSFKVTEMYSNTSRFCYKLLYKFQRLLSFTYFGYYELYTQYMLHLRKKI